MKHHAGFLLLELIIGLSIAATISLLLAGTLFRTNKARMSVDKDVHVYSHAALLQHQLERDLTTAFDPHIELVSTESVHTSPTDTKSGVADTQSAEQKPAQASKNEKDKRNQKIFYATNSGDQLELITCITTSPLATYWGEKTGSAKACVARVVYRLIKDPERKDSYMVTRQEGQNLDFDNYTSDRADAPRAYPLVKDVKTCTITYEIALESAGAKASSFAKASADELADESTNKKAAKPNEKADKTRAKKTNAEPKPEIEYKEFPDWTHEDSEDKEKISKEKEQTPLPRIPHRITVSITLWDPAHIRETAFKFIYNTVKETARSDKKQEQAPAPSAPTQNNTITSKAPVARPATTIARQITVETPRSFASLNKAQQTPSAHNPIIRVRNNVPA